MKELETKMKKEWRNVKKRGMEQSNGERKQRGNVGDTNGRKVEDALQDNNNNTFTVTFQDPAADGLQFRGFFIQSRLTSDMTTLVGEFIVIDSDNSQLRPCGNSDPVSDARNYRAYSQPISLH